MQGGHPTDFALIHPQIKKTAMSPTWIGQVPHHNSNFELVKRLRVVLSDERDVMLEEHYVLLAVAIEPDRFETPKPALAGKAVTTASPNQNVVRTRRRRPQGLLP